MTDIHLLVGSVGGGLDVVEGVDDVEEDGQVGGLAQGLDSCEEEVSLRPELHLTL